ncbi:MAG: hypothetical protein LC650_04210 [Actinobacteria bacterium]|nr:hypothetical protein [Actinomycetota bacterium]
MPLSNLDKLRGMLGEPIGEGESESDTLFSDAQLEGLIEETNQNLERAAYEGWRLKAAHYANLVDVVDGNAARALSDLMGHADKMIKVYMRASAGPTEGRTRIGKIVRT